MKPISIWIGYDRRETEAFAVCRRTLRKHSYGASINPIDLTELRRIGLYTRPTSTVDGKLWDDISDAPMSTEFAVSRFLAPILAQDGWAIFMDCDIMCRRSLTPLFHALDETKAVMCVQHDHVPGDTIKMDGQAQTRYARKNWSSVMAFNCEHKANRKLTAELINSVPGRDLHRFCWLKDNQIGALRPRFNWLAGVTQGVDDPCIVHWTEGGPWLEQYRDVAFADEWFQARREWLAEDVVVPGRATTYERTPININGTVHAPYLG